MKQGGNGVVEGAESSSWWGEESDFEAVLVWVGTYAVSDALSIVS